MQIRSHAQKYLIKLCKKYSIILSTKKFKNRESKHLNFEIESKSDITQMNKYDRKILDLFKYYNREYLLVNKYFTDSIKEADSTKEKDISVASCVVNSQNDIYSHQNINNNIFKVCNEIEELMKYNSMILSSAWSFSNVDETKLIIKKLLINYENLDMSRLFEDFKTIEETVRIFNLRSYNVFK